MEIVYYTDYHLGGFCQHFLHRHSNVIMSDPSLYYGFVVMIHVRFPNSCIDLPLFKYIVGDFNYHGKFILYRWFIRDKKLFDLHDAIYYNDKSKWTRLICNESIN